LFNVIAWSTTAIVIVLSVAWVYASMGGKTGG
jgi:hypothetical protein